MGWHENPLVRAMWAATLRAPESQLVPLQPGAGAWSVRLTAGANSKLLRRELPTLIEQFNTDDPLHPEVKRLGIENALRSESHADGADYAIFFMPSHVTKINYATDVIPSWISELLANPGYRDTSRKLLDVTNVDEPHIFLATGSRTSDSVDHALWSITDTLPTSAPTVADGITHLWAASARTNPGIGPWAALWVRHSGGWVAVPLATD